MEPAHIIALIFLSISSIKDLRTRRGLKDKTYIAAITLIALSFFVTSGPAAAGSSILQALLGLLIGVLMRLLFKFGGADVWTLALITSTFPETIVLKPVAYTLIPLVLWLKIYKLTGREKAPAIPALTAGFLLCLLIL